MAYPAYPTATSSMVNMAELRPSIAGSPTRLAMTSTELSNIMERAYGLSSRINDLRDRLIGGIPRDPAKEPGHVEPPGHLNRIDSQINGIAARLNAASKTLEEIENCA